MKFAPKLLAGGLALLLSASIRHRAQALAAEAASWTR
jgi:hypothetical protein